MNIQKHYTALLDKLANTLHDINDYKDLAAEINHFEDFVEYYSVLNYETEKLTRTGAWRLELGTNKLLWTKGVYDIHEINYSFVPTVETAISFYEKDSQPIIAKAVQDAIQYGKPFDEQLILITQSGKKINVHSKGDVIRDSGGHIVAVYGTFHDITEIFTYEEKLIESESKYRMIFENAISAIIIINEKAHFVDVNRAFTAILGYSKQEVLNKPVGQLTLPKYQLKIRDALQQMLQGKLDVFTDDIEIRHKEGHIVWVHLNAHVSKNKNGNFDMILVEMLDITEMQKNKVLLQQSEEKYRQLFHFMPLGVSLADSSGQLIENNHHAEVLLGLSAKEHNSRTIDGEVWQIIRKDGTPMPPEEFASVRALKENKLVENVEMGIKKTQSETTWINVSAIPVVNDNGVIISYTDITEKIIHEQALLAYNKELQDINRTKDKLFSIISHDLKNPFATLLGFSDLLLKNFHKYTPEKIKSQIQIIHDVSANTFKFLEDILMWARAQSNRIQFQPENIDLFDSIHKMALEMQALAQKKLIIIETHVAKDICIIADYSMLQTVLRNLISNAIKYTPHNGRIVVSAMVKENQCIISVEDNGIGIDSDRQEQLFDLNNNFSTNGTDNEPGSGFGLILCKEFVEKQGGQIWFRSQVDQGSVFSFSLPLA